MFKSPKVLLVRDMLFMLLAKAKREKTKQKKKTKIISFL